jgi:hypothetical protein
LRVGYSIHISSVKQFDENATEPWEKSQWSDHEFLAERSFQGGKRRETSSSSPLPFTVRDGRGCTLATGERRAPRAGSTATASFAQLNHTVLDTLISGGVESRKDES